MVQVDIKLPKLLDFIIIRDVIPTYSLDVAYMVDDEIGYIKLLVEKIDNAPLYPAKEEKETEKKAIRFNFTYGAMAGVNFYQGFLNMGDKREAIANDFKFILIK